MIDRADLDAAATAGIIGADCVDPLLEFLAARAQPAPTIVANGEEDLRFIRNFHDVFLAIGIGLFSAGLAVAVGVVGGRNVPWLLVLVLGGGALLWVLAEVFAGRRRQFLPSIALCVSLSVFGAAAGALLALAIRGYSGMSELLAGRTLQDASDTRLVASVAALAFTATAFGFYARFRLPFAMGLGGAGAAFAVLSLLFLVAPDVLASNFAQALLPCGLVLFAAGIWYDARDPARTTRFSDNGFWLHVAAAPLILNGTLALVGGNSALGRLGADEDTSLVRAIVTLIVVGALGFVSLVINRRALVVSALVTTGIAIALVMNATGLGAGALIAGTLVTLGGFVLVIGASWHVMRRGLLQAIRPTGLLGRIIPPESSS